SATELRSHLASKLPPYMVPSAFVLLDALPLNANGKLDRRALPDPGSERPDLAEAMVPPRTPLERSLCDAFARAPGLEQVGVYDSFFALGGDSLRSVRLLALAKEQGIRLSLEQVFEHQTVDRLAVAVECDQRQDVNAPTESSESRPFSLISADDRE